MKYEIALFDLDGTLSESGEGILDCVRMIFTEMDRPMPDEKVIRSFIGPPMYESLKRCGFSDEDALLGTEIYKRNFIEHGIYKNKVYDGMYEVLDELKKQGVRMGVASTKLQPFTERIIDMLSLKQYFDVIGGSHDISKPVLDGEKRRCGKVDVMQYAIDTLRQSENDRIVMLGDTKFDADGAAAVGCDFIGCLFGYGTREEMVSYYTIGTPQFVRTPQEILGIISGSVHPE